VDRNNNELLAETEPKFVHVVPLVEYCQIPVPVVPVTAIPDKAPASTSATEAPRRLPTVVADEVVLAAIEPSDFATEASTGASLTPVMVTVTRAVSELPFPSEAVYRKESVAVAPAASDSN
jgi:hypothetical protein